MLANPGATNAKIFELAGLTDDQGKKALNKSDVREVLRELRAKIAYETQITLKRVMLEETCVAFCDPLDLFTNKGTIVSPEKLPERVRRAISSIEVIESKTKDGEIQTKYKYKFWDKGKSLERISRHLGLYEKDNLQKAVRMFFLRADDENVPEIEQDPDVVEAEYKKIDGKKPVALLE